MNEKADLTAIAALAYKQLTEEEKSTVTSDFVYMLRESVKKERKDMIPAERRFIELAMEFAFKQLFQT